ncbi:5-oxoprolinase subunit PxpA [Ferruginibacter sp. SUN106]|uniref:5-oxoprolinase subunit PxpA n=1 Tax=Ferruginibacter sp. SUN106 TaxID=2978348 RepID=UPI003D36E529
MIDINCDMGEGIGNEAALMPYINSANIACGYHAGDVATMRKVIALCLQCNVHIGAHPSFPDRENFGRTPMQLSEEEIYTVVTEQLIAINKVAKECGVRLHHVKPHGALYNMAAKDAVLAKTIAKAVKDFDASLIYYGLSGSVMIEEASKLGLITAAEVFADRTYQSDGSLTPRHQSNALLQDKAAVVQQVIQFVRQNKVQAVTGEEIFVKADTICVHGDGAHAVEFAKAIHQKLNEK